MVWMASGLVKESASVLALMSKSMGEICWKVGKCVGIDVNHINIEVGGNRCWHKLKGSPMVAVIYCIESP